MPDVTLTIGGSGALPDAILASFPPAVRPKISVLPFVSREQHLEILGQHDVFIFPSLSEGFLLGELAAAACVTTFTASPRGLGTVRVLLVPMCSTGGMNGCCRVSI
jgi:glycosyltransferase involved in cell wall biosynthesis